MLVEAAGPSLPDDVWGRYTAPETWPVWARHISEVRTDADELHPGATGQVVGPRGVTANFTVTDIDPGVRSWAWQVRRGPLEIRMEHHVLPTPAGGSRATWRLSGATAAVLQPYRLPAAAALRRLVNDVPADRPFDDEPEQVQTFDFAFASSYVAAARAFGITPASTGVEVGPQWLYVRYGPWRLVTPRSNIAGATVTGGFSFAKSAGPPHLSFADRGVSLTTNGDRALCLTFHEPVPVIEPTGMITHPGATIAVADPEALASALGLDV